MDAMRFDGSLGSAKALAAWIGDPARCIAGPGFMIENGYPDSEPGGFDLIGSDARGVVYKSAQPGDYVVRAGADYVIFGPEQYAVLAG